MKKAIALASLLAVGFSASARDTFDGCGIGWEVTPDKTFIAVVTRATTNSFIPPTFGITSGTMGCDQFEGFAVNERSSLEYIAQNYETIRAEFALGRGEYASAAAQSLDCDGQAFTNHVQKRYDDVVAPAQDGVQLYRNLKAEAAKVCS